MFAIILLKFVLPVNAPVPIDVASVSVITGCTYLGATNTTSVFLSKIAPFASEVKIPPFAVLNLAIFVPANAYSPITSTSAPRVMLVSPAQP